MLYEKKKLIIYRSICLSLLVLGIIIPIIISTVSKNNLKIIDDNGYINDYYEYSDKTDCEIEVVFNREVDSGYITVAFYDSKGKLLSKEEDFFVADDNTASSTFYIDGKVDSYEILSYDVSLPNRVTMIFVFLDIVFLVFFIGSLLLSYKEYEYNGNRIVVYAGVYHNYVKVNGNKLDEHNTLSSYTAIPLSCTLDDGTDIKVTITRTNRISLKINNQLYTKRR